MPGRKRDQPDMKKLIVMLFAVVCLSGCARYDVSLNNGTRMVNMRRPVLDKQNHIYIIKDASGNKHEVPQGKVSLIEPHKKSKFKNKSGSDEQFFINPS